MFRLSHLNKVKDKISSVNNPKFSFNFISFEDTLDDINKLNSKKASQITNIPVPVFEGTKDAIALFIYHNFNNSSSSSSFPTGLNYVDVRPAFKKDDKTDKEN